MVSTSTPASAQAIVMRRTFSVPAWWPARRGSPRRFAQRPLPSMMMPTCTGTVSGCGSRVPCGVDLGCASAVPATSVTNSDLQDFGLFLLRDLVDTLDERIRQLLQPFLSPPLVLLRDTAVFFGFA